MPFVFVHEHNNLFGDSYLKNVTCLQHEEDELPPYSTWSSRGLSPLV